MCRPVVTGVCESLGVSLGAGTSWSPGQCPCWSCLWDTVLGVEGCTGHGLGVLTKDSLCVPGSTWQCQGIIPVKHGQVLCTGKESKAKCFALSCGG